VKSSVFCDITPCSPLEIQILRSYFYVPWVSYKRPRFNVDDHRISDTWTRVVEVNTSRVKRELVSACVHSEAARRISITFGVGWDI
jgi:hypothetical protein